MKKKKKIKMLKYTLLLNINIEEEISVIQIILLILLNYFIPYLFNKKIHFFNFGELNIFINNSFF